MTRFRLHAYALLLALLPAIGCQSVTSPETREAPSAADWWTSAWRRNDGETSPLGLSPQARDIERNLGVDR